MATDAGAARLLDAARRGDAGEVRALLTAEPALVYATGDHAKTALHWAVEGDHDDVAGLLLDAGADPGARTAWGATPLDWAATMGSRRVARLLLERGAGRPSLVAAAALGMRREVESMLDEDSRRHRRHDAPAAPDEHWPADSAHILGDVLSDALYAAARGGATDVVRLLLERGASVNAKGVFGGTALHWAAYNGHADTVRLLLARGAATALRDARFAATPDEWAAERGHAEIGETIRRAAAGGGA